MKIIEEIGSRIGGVVTRLYQLIDTHVKDVDNPHRVTKAQVGLGSADNTADRDKPLSEAQRLAVDNLNKIMSDHASNGPIHRTSEQIRADIVDGDLPDTIARKAELGAYLPLAGGMMTGDVNMGVSKIVLGAYSMHENAGTLFLGGNGSSFVLHCAGELTHSADGEHSYPIWDAANDGHGSGLDADLLDGRQGDEYAQKVEMEGGDKFVLATLELEIERATAAEAGKVDKIDGKGLSSNDFTDAEKVRLAEVGTVADGLKQGPDALDVGGTPSATWHIGQGAGVVAKNSGGILEVRNAADDAYADMVVNGLTVKGNVAVEGDSFVVNAQTVETADNLILLNRGEVAAGVTKGVAGLEIDRGTQDNYKIIFDESDDRFKAGAGADLWPILLRDKETDLANGNLMVWDAATKRAKTGAHAPDSFALKADVPTSLKNPYPLTFSGAASGVYDGSSAFTVNIPSGLLLGETSATAYRGDWGKIAFDYSQVHRSKGDLDAALQTEINNKITKGSMILAGNGTALGYSFIGEGNYDTGMYSDSDGDLYFKKNDLKYLPVWEGDPRLSNARPASDVSAWAKAATKPPYNLFEISDAEHEDVSIGTIRRKTIVCNAKIAQGYRSRAAIGLNNIISQFSPVLLSVGVNDLGTEWIDYTFNINGRITSPAGTFALTSEIPTSLPANGGNADTVDGSHAWRLQSVNTDGSIYGADRYDLQSRYNAKGDGRFRLEIVGGSDAANHTDNISIGYSDQAGNADRATRLQTARKINGVDFDGTTDITIGVSTNGVSLKDLTNLTTPYTNPNAYKAFVYFNNFGGAASGLPGSIGGHTVGAGAAINFGNQYGAAVCQLVIDMEGRGMAYRGGFGTPNTWQMVATTSDLPAIFNSSTAPTSGMKKGDIWVKP